MAKRTVFCKFIDKSPVNRRSKVFKQPTYQLNI